MDAPSLADPMSVPWLADDDPGLATFGLVPGEVHLWSLDTDRCRVVAPFPASVLDDEELARAARFRDEVVRQRFICCRAALRWLLGQYLVEDPCGLKFELGAQGKPRLASRADLQFNLSHSGNIALIAVGLNAPLGVDVEHWRELADLQGMAERCLAPSELDWWKQQSPRMGPFFALWTCKEAFMKAVGVGIGLGLRSCAIDLSARPRIVAAPKNCEPVDTWHLVRIDCRPGVDAALCVRDPLPGGVRFGDLTELFYRSEVPARFCR